MKNNAVRLGLTAVMLLSIGHIYAAEVSGTLSTGNETQNQNSQLSGEVVSNVYSSGVTVSGSTISNYIVDNQTTHSVNFVNPVVAGGAVIPTGTEITPIVSSGSTYSPSDITFSLVQTPPIPVDDVMIGGVSFGKPGVKLNFSKPIQLQIPVGISSGFTNVIALHSGINGYSTAALTNIQLSSCLNGVAQIQNNVAPVVNGIATIYTCSASTFIATNPAIAVAASSGGAPLPVNGGNGISTAVNPDITKSIGEFMNEGAKNVSNTTNTTEENSETPERTETVNSEIAFTHPFSDIANSWAEGYIEDLYKKGVVNSNKVFRGNDSITRAEFLKMLLLSYQVELMGYLDSEKIFNDVSKDSWVHTITAAASEIGIIARNSNFRPNDTITRQEAAKLIYMMEKEAGKINEEQDIESVNFSDVSKNSEFVKYIESISGNFKEDDLFQGETKNNKKYFYPSRNLTRFETAKILSIITS